MIKYDDVISLRHELYSISPYGEWMYDYRKRIFDDMRESLNIYDCQEWFEHVRYIRTCPSCFCPNLQSFNAYPYANEKGFCCPACGNGFHMIAVGGKND